MANHLQIYSWDADNNVFARDVGCQSSRANIYLELYLPLMFIPILASVIFRQLHWDSVDFRRLSTTIAKYIVGAQTAMYVGGGRKPKLLGQYLPKIRVRSAVYPNFRYRQLPSASAGFHGLQYPNLVPNSGETGALRDSSGAPYSYLTTRGSHGGRGSKRRCRALYNHPVSSAVDYFVVNIGVSLNRIHSESGGVRNIN